MGQLDLDVSKGTCDVEGTLVRKAGDLMKTLFPCNLRTWLYLTWRKRKQTNIFTKERNCN